ncbi:MAG: cryptochrome/photolyase family protein [Rickettsiales bacterium]|nr:cryptochrome/photolyase family protein [Rickettsiales bacterium]
MKKIRNLVFILGDQLSHKISSLENFSAEQDLILMCEVKEEATYAPHHKKKIAFIFSAMRHFSEELKAKKFSVEYIKFDDEKQVKSFEEALANAIKKYNPEKIIITEASEYRVLGYIKSWQKKFSKPLEIMQDNRFIATHEEFESFAKGKKNLLMEFFYRKMRQKTGLLMRFNKPVGNKWNFDSENREAMPNSVIPPENFKIKPDKITKEVLDLVAKYFPNNFGSLDNFFYSVTARDAEKSFDDFIENRLTNFGKYQDAMREDLDFGFHSIISLYLNVGLLDALECCKKIEKAYFEGKCDINSAEGFIRQIIGWREYIRGIYWLFMPEYKEKNFFNAKEKLPDFYWDYKKTKMNCISNVVKQTYQNAYSHHIQRLMITGNFALISGISPDEINLWYMAVYADAFEWVELPNTHGMSIYADGGIVGSKPYAASGKYINRMSNFCKNCEYNVNKTTGEDACPFNFLYWDFMIKNHDKLASNMRLKFTYQNLKRKSEEEILQIKKQASEFISKY